MTIVTVDLTTGTTSTEDIPEHILRRDAGCGLIGTRLLLERTPAGLDPFAPETLLLIAGSTVTGHDGVGLARCAFLAKSPATGGIGESRVEGTFPVALAATGIEVLVLRGRAPMPSIVIVSPRGVRIEPTRLWTQGTIAATDALIGRFGTGASVAVIGPAGERGVRFSSIVTDRTHAASRMGLGAIAGSKQVKAVVVLPGAQPIAHDPQKLAALTEAYRRRIDANPQTAQQHGRPGAGAWPVSGGVPGYVSARNSTTAVLPTITVRAPDGAERVATTSDAAARITGVAACPGCPLDCIKTFANTVDDRAAGLDEESLAAIAYALCLTDLDVLLDTVAHTRDWGVDPVSLAGVVAFAAECAERSGSETGPRFGDQESLLPALRGAALREPEWAWLSDGVVAAAEHVDPALRDAALHVKGLETTTWDPRASAGYALATAVSPVGPRYDIVEHDIDFDPVDGPPHGVEQLEQLGPWSWASMERLDDERIDRTAFLLNMWSGLDAIGICLLAGPPVRELNLGRCASLVSAVTGWDVTPHEILAWGHTRLALMREYNAREGVGPDTLPDRFFDDPLDAGRFTGTALDHSALSDAVETYYARTRSALETS